MAVSWRVRIMAGLVAMGVCCTAACDEGLDTTRPMGARATLGDAIYGALCDRLGASVFTEDLSGQSYGGVCHYDDEGRYLDEVDESRLPPVSSSAAVEARRLSRVKMERLVDWRGRVIRALNVTFPDEAIANPQQANLGGTVPLHDALRDFTQQVTRLYESSPGVPGDMPAATRAMGTLLADLGSSDEARAALMRVGGRRGYRPNERSLGAIQTLLSYPELRQLIVSLVNVVGDDGAGVDAMQQWLLVLKRQLERSEASVSGLERLVVDEATATVNRPREGAEWLSALLLDEADVYDSGGSPPRFIVRRDPRGFAVPIGNLSGAPGTVPAPFIDINGDGWAEVDGLGRFVDGSGTPLVVPTPFFVPNDTPTSIDAFGRPLPALYEYLDLNRSALAVILAEFAGLVDATPYAPEGAPEPWLSEKETLMYALAGLSVVAGPREQARYDHDAEQVLAADDPCQGGVGSETESPCTSYLRFVGEQSPLADLAHAVGQVLADPRSDTMLAVFEKLLDEHEDKVARLLGAALRVSAFADEHDQRAAQGLEPLAELPYEVPVFDELAAVLGPMSDKVGLVRRLIEGFANPILVSPHGQDPMIPGAGAQHFGETLSTFVKMRDRYQYDPNFVNGPAYNVTAGYPSIVNPQFPVDRLSPLQGDNRSMFERSLQLIYDGARVKACNKPDAYVYTGAANIYWPLVGSGYAECELFSFDNIGAVFLDSTLPVNHPKRAELKIKDDTLNSILNFVGSFTSADEFLEDSSGLKGLTLHPEPPALARLLFFGAASDRYGQLPDFDAVNQDTNPGKFISGSIEPISGQTCPVNGNGVNECPIADVKEVLRLRDANTIFSWERLGFYEYLAPTLRALAETGCNWKTVGQPVTACDVNDNTGENVFLDMVSALWRHWPGSDHDSVCDSSLPKANARYCSGAGMNRYEPILADVFADDLVPALHEFSKALRAVEVTVARGPDAGTVVRGDEVMEWLMQVIFSQAYAKDRGMTDRLGRVTTTWTDGTPQGQLTVFTLFADALRGMDLAFEQSALPDVAERKSQWRRARSNLVDQFGAISGQAAGSQFTNPAIPRLLRHALRLTREQINGHCPSREEGIDCQWGRKQIGLDVAQWLSGPMAAASLDVAEAIRVDESARRQLGRFMSYALLRTPTVDAVGGVMTSMGDLSQLAVADGEFAPLMRALAAAANPANDPRGAGALDRGIQLLGSMTDPEYDRYLVLEAVLPKLVTPIDGGAGRSPLEIAVVALADIHREDASLDTPLSSRDYAFFIETIRKALVDKTRGFEQLYAIVNNQGDGQ